MNEICIILLILIILLVLNNRLKKEKFELIDDKIKVRGISNLDGSRSSNTKLVDISDQFFDRTNLYNLSSDLQTAILNVRGLEAQGVLPVSQEQKKIDNQQKYLDNKVGVYQQQLMEDNLETTYFYNDLIDQNKIKETSNDVINSIDNVDFSQPKELGIDKCLMHCDGICTQVGYNGIGSCIPVVKTNYGTLYKNPTFTYGLQVPYYNKNNQTY
jgi:hypothetical protein